MAAPPEGRPSLRLVLVSLMLAAAAAAEQAVPPYTAPACLDALPLVPFAVLQTQGVPAGGAQVVLDGEQELLTPIVVPRRACLSVKGTDMSIIAGVGKTRLFVVQAGGALLLDGVSLTGGSTEELKEGGDGGAISVGPGGFLQLKNANVFNNIARGSGTYRQLCLLVCVVCVHQEGVTTRLATAAIRMLRQYGCVC
jgi:hypothetical protein